MGFLSFFSTRAREAEIQDIIKIIVSLARRYPERFFVKNLSELKSSVRYKNEDKIYDILHHLLSIHLERNGVFEQEFNFVNENLNVSNTKDLEVRRLYDSIKDGKLELPTFSENTTRDLVSTIKMMTKKYTKYPSDFFIGGRRVFFITAGSKDEKLNLVMKEFNSVLNYYGFSSGDLDKLNNIPELKQFYWKCILKVYKAVIKNR